MSTILPQTAAGLRTSIVTQSLIQNTEHVMSHNNYLHLYMLTIPPESRIWYILFSASSIIVLPHQQLPHFDCGGCSITSASSSPGLGLPRRPGNMARSTAISIFFMTRSRSISTACDTL